MNSQEAQQAQTIDKSVKQLRGWLKENSVNGLSRGPFYDNIESVLNHVDSQAQKIAQLTKERDAMTATAYRLGSESQQYISEARAEAEKWRQETIEYKYGNQWTQDGFALEESEKLPWEKL